MNQNQNQNEASKPDKLENITEILWKIWWTVLYVIILPLSISGALYYILRENVYRLSISVIVLIALLFIFQLPYDKYRDKEKKLFTKSDLPNLRHIMLYFAISLGSIIFSLIFWFMLSRFNETYQDLIQFNGVFTVMLHLVLSIIIIGIYYITRNFPKKIGSLKDFTYTNMEKIIIVSGIAVRTGYLMVSTLLMSIHPIISIAVIDALGLLITSSYYKKNIEKKQIAEFSDFAPIININNNELDLESNENDENLSNNSTNSPQNQFKLSELPKNLSSNIFFNIFPIIHIILIAMLFLWDFGIPLLSLSFQIFIPLFSISLAIKSTLLIIEYDLSKTRYIKQLTSSKKIHRINEIASIISFISCIFLYFSDIDNIWLELTAIIFLGVLVSFSYFRDFKKSITSKKFISSFLTISTITTIILGVIIIPMPWEPEITIFVKLIGISILIYVDLEILIRKGLLNERKLSIILAFLFSIILFEIFFSLANISINYLLENSVLPYPELEELFRFSIFSLAFLLTTIFSVLRTYYSRLKRKTSTFLKIVVLILHILLMINFVIIYSFNLGGLFLISEDNLLLTRYIVPCIIFSILTVITLNIYYDTRIFSGKDRILINVFGLDIISVFIGIAVLLILGGTGAWFIMFMIITFSLMIHQYVEKGGEILSLSAYESRIKILGTLLFSEIGVSIFLFLFVDLGLSTEISLFLTSFSMILVIKLTSLWKGLFSKRFVFVFNLICLFIQLFSLPVIIFNIPDALVPLDPSFLNILKILISGVVSVIYLTAIFVYSLMNGILIRKFNVIIVNTLVMLTYLIISVIISFSIFLALGAGIIGTILEDLMIQYFAFSIVLIFIIFMKIDDLGIHALYNGPKIWISNAYRKGMIKNSGEGTKKAKILEKTLELWEPEKIEQTNPIELLTSEQDPQNLIFKAEFNHRINNNLVWLLSFICIILNILFFINIDYAIAEISNSNIAAGIYLTISGILARNLIVGFLKSGIIDNKKRSRFNLIINAFLIVVTFYIIILLLNYFLPDEITLHLYTVLVFEVIALIAYGVYGLFDQKLIEKSKKGFFIGKTALGIFLGFTSAALIAVLIRNITIYIANPQLDTLQEFISPLSYINPNSSSINLILSNIIYIISLIFIIGLLFIPIFLNNLKKYNRLILRSVYFEDHFPENYFEEHNVSTADLDNLIYNGVSNNKVENMISEKFPIIRVFAVRRIIFILIYLLSPIIIFETMFLFGNFYPSIYYITPYLVYEGLLVYFGVVYVLFIIDKKKLNLTGRKTSSLFILRAWLIFNILASYFIAFLLEYYYRGEDANMFGVILLFLLLLSIFFSVTNYYLDEAQVKNIKWMKIKDSFTQSAIVITSTLYLVYFAVYAISSYQGITVITPQGEIGSRMTIDFFSIAPILLIIMHISFYFSYLRKKPEHLRFLRTFVLSFLALVITVVLFRYRVDIIGNYKDIVIAGTFFDNTQANADLFKEMIISTISIITVSFSLFYYYATVPKQNILINLIYQAAIIWVGYIFLDNLLYILFELIFRSNFSDVLTLQNLMYYRYFFVLGLNFILYYHWKKHAYFDIYKGYLDENQYKIKEIGLFGGLGRSIGVGFIIYSIIKFLEVLLQISISMFVPSGSISSNLRILTETIFSIGLIIFFISITLYSFLSGYLKNLQHLSYRIRYVLRIIAILSIVISFGISVFLYEKQFRFVLPFIIVACYYWLHKIQKKYPYRANVSIGLARSILIFVLVYWIIHEYIFYYISSVSSSLIIELCFAAGFSGYLFGRTKYIGEKARKYVLSIVIILSDILISYAIYLSILLMPFVNPADIQYAALVALDIFVALYYFSIGIYQNKFSKQIWASGWYVWIALPIINFNLLLKMFGGIDFIKETLNVIGGIQISGSIVLSALICTILYLPVILYKFKNFFKYFFLIAWIVAIPTWIWISIRISIIFKDNPYISLISPLLIVALTLISILPLLYKLKYWKMVTIIWGFIALTNAIYFSYLVNLNFVEDSALNIIFNGVLDVSICLFIFGMFFMIFCYNPAIKEIWKKHENGVIIGFCLSSLGILYIFYSLFYIVMSIEIYALCVSGIVTGLLMLSGKSMAVLKNKLNPIIFSLVAISAGILLFSIAQRNGFYLLTYSSDIKIIQIIYDINPSAIGLGLIVACGIFLVGQARSQLANQNWRSIFLIFSLAIGDLISSIIQSLTGIVFNYYMGLLLLIAIAISYPSFRKYRTLYYLLIPLPVALFLQQFLMDTISEWIFLLSPEILGFEFCLFIISYISILGFEFYVLSKLYLSIQQKNYQVIHTLNISEEEIESLNINEFNNELVKTQLILAKKAMASNKELPNIFKIRNKKTLFQIFSSIIGTSLYLLGIILCQLIPANRGSQFVLFLFIASIANFIVLKYNRERNILQKEALVDKLYLISANMLYFSLGIGFTIIVNYEINLFFTFIYGTETPFCIQIGGIIATISLCYYLILVIFENRLHLFKKTNLNSVLKIAFWLIFTISMATLIYNMVNTDSQLDNLFILLIFLTICSFNFSNHLKKYSDNYSKSLEMLVNLDNISQQGISSQNMQDDENQNSENWYQTFESENPETLGIDTPSTIIPPEEIKTDDLISNIDIQSVGDALEDIFSETNVQDNAGAIAVSDDQVPTIIDSNEQIPIVESEIAKKLDMIKKKQARIQKLKNFISEFDAIIKQSFLIEISYFISLLIIGLLPVIPPEKFIDEFIISMFTFTLCMALFYNYLTGYIIDKYRLKLAQITLVLLIVVSIILPFAIFNTFGINLGMVNLIDESLTINWDNLSLLIAIIAYLVIKELLKFVKNYASTKNIHIKEIIVDKWRGFMDPIQIVLLAYIIANFIGFKLDIKTRLVLASLILFIEIVLDKYMFKIYNRFTRSRYLFISWILCSVTVFIQLIFIGTDYIRPLSLIVLTILLLAIMQYMTIVLSYNYSVEKHYRKKQMIQEQSDPESTADKIDYESFDENRNLLKRVFSNLKRPDNIQKQFNILTSIIYLMVGVFLGAELYENILQFRITEIRGLLELKGIDPYLSNLSGLLQDPLGADFLIIIGLLFLVPIIVYYLLVFIDKFFLKFLNLVTRDVLMIIQWISLSIYILITANLFTIHYGDIIETNLTSPILLFLIAIMQYSTMYLITNTTLHSTSIKEISDLVVGKTDRFSSDFQIEAEKIMGYAPQWEFLSSKTLNKYKRKYLIDLISILEPNRVKLARRVNMIIGIFIYLFIGYSTYTFIYNISYIVFLSFTLAVLMMYLQAELNYFKIKTFTDKQNYLFSLVTWLVFSSCIAFLPLLLLNSNITIGFWFAQVILSNYFYISTVALTFSVFSFYTAYILKRYYDQIDIKLIAFKYIRLALYISISLVVGTFFASFDFETESVLTNPILLAFLSGSIALNISMAIEKYRPVMLKRTVIFIKFGSGLMIILIIALWVFQYINIEIEIPQIAIIGALIALTLAFPIVYNPFKQKGKARPIYWLIIAIELGILMSIIPGFGSIMYGLMIAGGLIILYPVIFKFKEIMEIIQDIVQNFRIIMKKIIKSIKKTYQKIKNFIYTHRNLLNLILVIIIAGIVFMTLNNLTGESLDTLQKISISVASGSIFLFPIFYDKGQLKTEETFSKMIYYSTIVYITFNFVLFTFIEPNIIWILVSAILLSSILLYVVYQREKMYNLPIKWRFSLLILLFTTAIILAIVLTLFFMGKISI